ncbi:37S ribosomal protein S5 [Aspergillus granulosus]|uniref:37S ribosomal protein S5 n=1 Tax=Aspergillus granulosus TaxID=176169 RepID=A0ABR4I1Z9_9EURO
MSFSRPARCLICSFSRAASTVGPRVPRRQFQISATRFSDEKPKPPVTDGEVEIRLRDLPRTLKPEHFKEYTKEEKAALSKHYTPEQIAAIEAGEAAIDPEHLANQFDIRDDPLAFKYLDDFSVIEPGVDKHVRAPESNSDYTATLKTEEDFIDDFAQFFSDLPEDFTVSDWVRFAETNRMTIGKEENELKPSSSLVPDLFGPGETLEGPTEKPPTYYDARNDGETGPRADEEPSDAMKALMKATGYSVADIRNIRVKILVSHRVVNQTRLGKIQSQYILAVAGNGKGLLGIGEGKSEEMPNAQAQATFRAIRNMQPVPRYENRTIYGDVKGKVGAVELKLMSRPPGFGLRCQSLIYEMCRAAGIKDLAARVDRSRNHMNTVKAAYEALMSQRIPEDIARARGKKLVDVRKVYYSGSVSSPKVERRTLQN